MSSFQHDEAKLEYVKGVWEKVCQESVDESSRILEELPKPGSKRNFPEDLQMKQMILPFSGPTIKIQKKQYFGKIIPKKTKTTKFIKKVLSDIPARPERTFVAFTQTNIRCKDNKVLDNYPYFDDNDNDVAFWKRLEDFGVKIPIERNPKLDSRTLLKLVAALNDSASQAVLQLSEDEIFEYISIIWNRYSTGSQMKDFHDKKTMSPINENIDEPMTAFKPYDLSVIGEKFCPICNIFDCVRHQPDHYLVDKEPVNDMVLSEDALPCSPACFMNYKRINNIIDDFAALRVSGARSPSNPESPPPAPLSINTKILLHSYMGVYDNNYCAMTELMDTEVAGIECWQVYIHAMAIQKETGQQPAKIVKKAPISKKTNDKKAVGKKAACKKVWPNNTDQMLYEPCNHPGQDCATAKNCCCRKNRTFCEKFCGCFSIKPNAVACPRAFTGCGCTKGCKNSKLCICLLNDRECDEDLCSGPSHIFDSSPASSSESSCCKNVALQRGLTKKLTLGVSKVAGNGVFLNDTAEKDDLISEYCGEVISVDDAEVRGHVYDKQEVSYLFNLVPGELDCDAGPVGNKIRYANHCPEDGDKNGNKPNLYPRIKTVNGEAHIGMYASRKIERNEELLFDYGKGFTKVHNFSS